MICLPMAGLSSRFTKAGYTLPKYMLDLRGQSVFAHALRSFEAYFESERILIVCRQDYDTPAFVRAECRKVGLPLENLDIVVLNKETSGQAETVSKGLLGGNADITSSLTIFNIDTFRPKFCYPTEFDIEKIDGYLEVFEGEGDHWSFAAPDHSSSQPLKVSRVTEKERISNLCSTGLYYFKTVELFQRLYGYIEDCDPATLQGGERYIAPLYNKAIAEKLDIRYKLIRPEEVQFCGTPAEYEALL
jgi:NDP-sugar pyrophosphorylase family protein